MESQQLIQRIEELVGKIEAMPDPEARAVGVELLQSLMELNATGIERMLEMTAETGAAGAALIEGFAQDELVRGLLLLYGLHPVALETRVAEALEKVRPYLSSHGGDAELLGIDEGVVRVRLQNNSNGHSCPSTAMTLKQSIEAAIYDAAPDLIALEVEGLDQPSAPAGLVQLGRLKSKSDERRIE